MCLTITKTIPKIAKTNLLVFKVGRIKRTEFSTCHRSYYYHLYKENSVIDLAVDLLNGLSTPNTEKVISKGYHSLPDLKTVKKYILQDNTWGPFKNIGLFIIPKGSKFFVGTDNGSTIPALCSNQITYIGSKLNPISWLVAFFKDAKQYHEVDYEKD